MRNCENSGIEAVYTPHTKNKLKFRMQGQTRYTRAKTLGEKFEPDNILSAIEANRNKQNSLVKTNEKIKAESKNKPIKMFGHLSDECVTLMKLSEILKPQELHHLLISAHSCGI